MWKIRSILNTDSVSIRTPIPIESEHRFLFNLNGDSGAIRTQFVSTVNEMQEYYDHRLDAWQESELGEEHQERTTSAEAVRDALDELII